MNKIFVIAALILIALSYFFADRSLALYCHEHTGAFTWMAEVTDLISPQLNLLIWPVIFFFSRFIFKRKRQSLLLLTLAISCPLVTLLGYPLKALFGRTRPALLFSEGIDTFGPQFTGADYSFPSSHAMIAGVLAGALISRYPKYTYLFLLAAFLLALPRVLLTAHYLSDVLAGITVGVLTAQWVYLKIKNTYEVL